MASRRPRGPGAVVGAALALACGCGSGAPAAGGNGALTVACDVTYSPTGAAERQRAADTTYIALDVHRGDAPADDARAHLTDLDRQESLALVGEGGQLTGSWSGYRRRLALEVHAGDDFVVATHVGPARHIVTQPATGSLQGRGRRLEVVWRKDPADGGDDPAASRTDLSLRSGYRATTAHPDAQHLVPAAELTPGVDAIEVVRRRDLGPAGAADGSRFSIGYVVAVPILVE